MFGGVVALPLHTLAATPNTLAFSSVLKDNNGEGVSTLVNISFAIYNVSTGGTPLWDESYEDGSGNCQQITPDSNGFFTVQLGSCDTTLTSVVDFTSSPLYLGVTVGTDTEATPRLPLASVAYARNSQSVGSLSDGGSDIINLNRSTSGQFFNFSDATDSFGLYNYAGSPEGNIVANIGSLALDTTNGQLYIKTTDTVNTGWTNVGSSVASDSLNFTQFADNMALDANTAIALSGNTLTLDGSSADTIFAANGDVTIGGDLEVTGGDISSTSTNFNILTTHATTVNFATAATSLTMGATSGTTSIRNDLVVDSSVLVVETDDNEVGIGTSSPAGLLHLRGDVFNQLLLDRDSATVRKSQISFRQQGAERFALGIDPAANNSQTFFIYDGTASANRLYINSSGLLQLTAYGAGTLTTDASGNVTTSSDERLKNVVGNFERGLSALIGLVPVNYHWNTTSGLDMNSLYTGFLAQNVQKFIPEAVGINDSGLLSLSDRPILATIINAIKELNAKVDALAIGRSLISASPSTNSVSSPVTNITQSIDSFNVDNVGMAEITEGQSSISVLFTAKFARQPIVVITPKNKFVGQYWIDSDDVNGFTIVLSEAATESVQFNWHAFTTGSEEASGGLVPAQVTEEQVVNTPTETVTETTIDETTTIDSPGSSNNEINTGVETTTTTESVETVTETPVPTETLEQPAEDSAEPSVPQN